MVNKDSHYEGDGLKHIEKQSLACESNSQFLRMRSLALCATVYSHYCTSGVIYTFMYFIVLYCIVLYCIVLMGWSLLPNALRPFQDLLCSPEFRYY